MSRTVKVKKAPGQEYWSRRPHTKHGATPGPDSKKVTHRTERQQGKREAINSAVDEVVTKL